jgi:hypothetical protein
MKIRQLSVHYSIQVPAARRFLPAIAIVLLACLAVLPGRAAAAVFDDFESYAVGSNLHGQGGWAGWAGDTNAGALVSSNFSFSPTRSVNITGPSDLVRTFSGATNGQWVFRVMQYIPSTSTGTNGVILMNTYRAPYAATNLNWMNWSVQILNNMDTGQVISDLGGGATNSMVKDQWVEVRCEINLAANSVSEFYNGQLLSTHAWQDGTGVNEIQALDLFANNAGPVYYDNVSLTGRVDVSIATVSVVNQGGIPHLVFRGSGGVPDTTFYVLTSTNIATPRSNWTTVGTYLFDGSGNFSVTNTILPSEPERFFLLNLP